MTSSITTTIAFLRENWFLVTAVVGCIVGLANLLSKYYGIKKLRLDLEVQRKKVAEEKKPQIVIATLDEVIEFSKKTPDPKKVRRFLIMKVESLLEEPLAEGVDRKEVTDAALALSNLSHDFSGVRTIRFAVSGLSAGLVMSLISEYISVILSNYPALARTLGEVVLAALLIFVAIMILFGIYELITKE